MSRSLTILIIGLATAAMLSTELLAQPGGGRGRGGRGGGFFGRGGSGELELLMRDDIRSEIELVDDQQKDLEEMGQEFREQMGSLFQEARESRNFDLIREKMPELRAEMEANVKEVLLPHQMDRLKQLAVQSRLRREGGAAGVLESDTVREKLNLSDEQLEEIREVAKEAQAELQEKIAELQKEARAKILAVLTPQQKETWEELVGDEYKFQERSRTRGRGEEGRGRGQEGRGRGRGRGEAGDGEDNNRRRGFGRRPE